MNHCVIWVARACGTSVQARDGDTAADLIAALYAFTLTQSVTDHARSHRGMR